MRSTAGVIPYQGVTFYILYQSANASYASVDDSKLVTTYGWGTSSRQINPGQTLTGSLIAGGQTYNRRYIYLNSDEAADGTHLVNLNTSWDTVITITLNNLQPSPTYGGYAYMQKTSEAPGASLTDPLFINIPFNVTSSSVALKPAAGPLPVLFTRFNAQCQADKSTSITWSTSQETYNNYFEVERSSDGFNWNAVSKVVASGNSSTEKNYQVNDPQGGTAQYRLKQVDRDGKISYSTTVKTSCEGRNVYVTLYPAPASDVVNLIIGSDKAVKTILQIYDAKGKLVINMAVIITKGVSNFKIPVLNLATGEYIIKGTNSELEISKRFTIVR